MLPKIVNTLKTFFFFIDNLLLITWQQLASFVAKRANTGLFPLVIILTFAGNAVSNW